MYWVLNIIMQASVGCVVLYPLISLRLLLEEVIMWFTQIHSVLVSMSLHGLKSRSSQMIIDDLLELCLKKYFASSDPHHGIQFIPTDNLSGISIWHSIWHVF